MNLIDSSVPEHLDVHVALDNSSTHNPLDVALASDTPLYAVLHAHLQLVADPRGALVRRAHHDVDRAQRAPLGPRSRGVDPDLDGQLEQEPQPYLWHKTADEVLNSLAHYSSGSLTQVTRGLARSRRLLAAVCEAAR